MARWWLVDQPKPVTDSNNNVKTVIVSIIIIHKQWDELLKERNFISGIKICCLSGDIFGTKSF
jgi:hypothetical protein